MHSNVKRQIIDIQAQADRIITRKLDIVAIEAFAQYHGEIKTYLTTHVTDDFISKFVQTIPDLN